MHHCDFKVSRSQAKIDEEFCQLSFSKLKLYIFKMYIKRSTEKHNVALQSRESLGPIIYGLIGRHMIIWHIKL